MDQIGNENTGTNSDGNSLPEFPWTQRQRVLSRGIRPRPKMLATEGFKKLENACITKVTGKKKSDAILCYITYDRSYVVEKLARDWGEVLTEIDRSNVLKLITEAKQRYREIEGE